MHVVVLENGQELHMPTGSMENIAILQQCDDRNDVDDVGDASGLEPTGGHPSLLKRDRASDVFGGNFGSLLRDCSFLDQSVFREDLDES